MSSPDTQKIEVAYNTGFMGKEKRKVFANEAAYTSWLAKNYYDVSIVATRPAY